MAQNIKTVGTPRVRSVCSSCHAPIFWAKTSTGKSMPLDFVPNPAGNVTIIEGVATVHSRDALLPDGVRFMPHHATCPNAAEHRKAR